MLTEYPYVPKTEFVCIRTDFPRYIVGPDDAQGGPIALTDQVDTLLKNEFLHLLPDSGQDLRGLEFHYGLDTSRGAHRLVLALEFVKLEPLTGDTFNLKRHNPEKFYSIEGRTIKPAVKSDWLARFGADYLAFTRVRRSSDSQTFEALDPSRDHQSFVFRWDGALERIMTDNPMFYSFRVWHIASPAERTFKYDGSVEHERDWGHDIGILATSDGSNGELLDDIEYAGMSYRMKGADLGSPCPPNCPKPVMRQRGIRARPECKAKP